MLSFIAISAAIALLWLRSRRQSLLAGYTWLVMLVLALAVALFSGQLEWIACVPVALFGLLCLGFTRLTGLWQGVAGLAIVLLSLALGLHVLPGFHSLLVVDGVRFAPDSLPYSLRLHLDKPLIGLFILALLQPLLGSWREALTMLRRLIPVAVVTWVLVTMGSFALGYIRFDLKIPGFLPYWLWANLFFTCVSEEALFRGFLQHQMGRMLANVRHGAVLALALAAILFGVAHIAGGIQYALLATLAGLGYGWAYLRTQRIEASILVHFSLNTLHIIFFSYPALQQ